MHLSELSIKKPIFAWMLMTGLIVLGGISFMRLGVSQYPDVDTPVVSVNVRLEGAAPEVIETEVIDTLEGALMSIPGIKTITSESESSEGTVSVEFDIERNIDLAMQDVQTKVSQAMSRLPKGITQPSISKINPEDQPIVVLNLDSAKYDKRTLMTFVNDRIKPLFSVVKGVGDITLNGYVDPNLRIWVNPRKLDAEELTVDDIIRAIQNEHVESPGGQVDIMDRQLFVRTMGEAETVNAFESLNITQRGGEPIYRPLPLKTVARVEEGLADVTRLNRVNGAVGVGISVRKQRGTNAVDVAKAIKAKAEEIQKTLPEGMNLSVSFDSSRFIEQAVDELDTTLLMSVALTAVVCWLFLGSLSSTFNVLMAIPTSIVGTFIVLHFADFTLNTFTLLGLSLAIGIVVDDSIMVLENIVRHQEMGKDRMTAALDGSREITFSAAAASAAIIAIFLPVAFMSGVIGRFFFQFGVTITVAVALSLVEALTLTPMRCSQFLDIRPRRTWIGQGFERIMDGGTRFYGRALAVCLRFRWLTLFTALALAALSFLSLKSINKEFLPPEDQSRFNIRLKTEVGSSLSHSDRKFSKVEEFLSHRPEIDKYVLQVGGGSPGDSNSGSILVTMKEPGKRGLDAELGRERTQQEFMDLCRKELKKIPDLKVTMQDLSTRGFGGAKGAPVEFAVQGPDWSRLAHYADMMSGELEKSGLVTDIDNDYQAGVPELHVVPDRKKAYEHGVSVAAIDQTVSAMIGGAIVATYPKDGHRYDVRVKLEDSNEDARERMKTLWVRNNRGERIALRELVRLEDTEGMVRINRSNRERAITITANIKKGRSQQDALGEVEKIARKILPSDFHIAFSGSSQSYSESFDSLIFALVLGVFVAYMLLASQFNSLLDPIAVLISLPFSLTGALGALLMTGASLNIFSMIGFILLMGIVKKNSILLVDFTNIVRAKEGLSISEAILKACPIRLRPIIMTSLATIVGAVPAALALGAGAESRKPMAIVIIGGVLVSTFVTLFVTPCLYSVLTRASFRAPSPNESDIKRRHDHQDQRQLS